MPAGELGQDAIARHVDLLGGGRDPLEAESGGHGTLVHHAALGERKVLAVVGHGDTEGQGVLQRGAHQLARHHRVAVVAHRDRPGGHHLAELGELLALLSHRDAADGVHAREPRRLAARLDEPDGALVVNHRIGVGHGADAGEPAGHGRGRAGGDRFALLLARLAQVHMHVNQAGGHHEAGGIELQGVVGVAEIAPHTPHHAALEIEVGHLIEATGRIHHAAAANQHRSGHFSSPPRDAQSGEPPASR